MTSNIVRPLQIASEKLLDALGTIRLRARNEGRECRSKIARWCGRL
jgi:hypothetical protein